MRSLAELEPDLIVDTGDNLGHSDGIEGVRARVRAVPRHPRRLRERLERLLRPGREEPVRGTSAARRAHDRAREAPRHRRAARASSPTLGWHDLNNTAASLDLRGTHFEFFGVDDPHRGSTASTSSPRHRRAARRGPARRRDVARRGIREPAPADGHGRRHPRAVPARAQLVREPRRAAHARRPHPRRPGVRARLRRARHQLRHPAQAGQGPQRLAARRCARRYLNVSAGLGTSIYAPVRFACPPEATLLTLVPADVAAASSRRRGMPRHPIVVERPGLSAILDGGPSGRPGCGAAW